MTDWTVKDYPHALAGDLVFTKNKMNSLPIYSYQRARRFPHADKTHVACVVSPVDIMEAMLGKASYSLSFADWLNTRPEEDQFFVLRHPNATPNDTAKVIDAALYYLNEEYALKDALKDTFKKTPERIGHSICSVTASKVLKRSGHLDPQAISSDRQIYPGPLYALLVELGWTEISPKPEYFTSEIAQALPSPIQQRVMTAKANTEMRSSMAVADDIIGTFDGYLDVLPTQDTFFSMAASNNSFVLDVISNQILDIVHNHVRALIQINEGVTNWKDTQEYQDQLSALLSRTRDKEKLVFKLLSELLKNVESSFDLGSIGTKIRQIHSDLSDGKDLSADRLQQVLDVYLQCELSFLAIVGKKASKFESNAIEYDAGQLKSLSEKDRATVQEICSALSAYYDNTRDALGKYAIQIGNIRNVVATLISEESMSTIDDLVNNRMEDMLFEKTRSSKLFQQAEELRASSKQTTS